MMLKILLPIFIFASVFNSAIGQKIINGNVLDLKGDAIPYAHLKIEGSARGTLSNSQGNFSLILQPGDSAILISCIGYKSKRIEIEDQEFLTIQLVEDVLELKSVTIKPTDVGKTFIDLIIENIPNNYTTSKELITGFIREKVSRDSLGTDIFYISEAEVEVLKEDYRKSKNRGDVRMIKGRKVTGDLTDLSWRIYAGGHLAHRFDPIMRRTGPLGKNKVDKYSYDISDTLVYNGQPLFKLIFWNENNTHLGTFYVLDETYALIKSEQFMIERYPENGIFSRDNSRKFIDVVTEFDQVDNEKWSVSYVNYKTGFNKDTTELYLNSIFTAHDKAVTEEVIPYRERIQYGQFLLEETEEYDPNYWDGFNIAVPDSVDQEFLNSLAIRPEETEEDTESKVLNINLDEFFEFSYGLSRNGYTLNPHTVIYNQNGLNLNENLSSAESYSLGLKYGIGLLFNDRWSVQFEAARGFENLLRETLLGVGYRFRLTKRSRFSLNSVVNFGWGINGIELLTAEGLPPFELNDKEFNATNTRIYTVSEYGAIIPSLEILFEKSSRLQFVVGFQDFFTVSSSNGLWFREEQNIFRRKTAYLETGDGGLEITGSSDTNLERSFNLYAGFKLSF